MQPKILFVHSGNETFIRLDRELLGISFEVLDFYTAHKFPIAFHQTWQGIRNADALFCWFASWNTFWAVLLAKILRKPSILVIGGYDVASLPIANYGHQRGGLKKWVSRWAMGLADILVPFSHASQREAEKITGIPAGRMKMIYLGVPDLPEPLSITPRERMALTVGKVEWANLKRKGLEPFVRAATQLPDVQFVLVGDWADDSIEHLRSTGAPNVTFPGRVSDEELIGYYRRASVYVQASLHEGFGLSVAEAMLAGCIPVVTQAGSLPEVVGECGVYCDSSEPADIARAVKIALNSPSSDRVQARERILREFPLEKRRRLLEQAIWSMIPQRINTHVN